ncbi:MAG TPA: NADH-quinone oxidoreductase subunit L [Sphingomonadaceae bacterium]|nr:NADH-quinone oxidoreductase subunit L [Sphingomonadaceae bacterium]
MIQLIVFLPLAAALIAGLGNRAIGNTAAKLVTTGALLVSCALSWPVFLHFLGGGATAQVVPVLDWIHSGDLKVDWALRVDALTAVMLVVVTTVSSLVHVYSWGYMADDDSQPRFFAYLSLFTFAMLMLVTADTLVQMFFGWEGVGLASYLLIGFWYTRPAANAAAIKAFVVNRVGDFGFMLGIFGTFLVFGTVSIPAILAAAPGMAGSTIGFVGLRVDTMTLLCLLLFVGAMGKSAQLGLHTWLPDAMEGPTPVSALIHAATMVTAGVFMVCRLSPMFETSAVATNVVLYVGAATAVFAATVACVQNDIKRVIAYSTCSQLGYMFFAAGVGAYGAAMFHLFTHAFFKALLFLCAGSVIQAMHHEQDMRFYGALRKRVPVTFWTMLAGTLAITGVGLLAIPGLSPAIGFAGFHSKDAIIEAAFASGTSAGEIAFAAGVFAALLTSFYSWRLVFLTFYGKPRWAGSEYVVHAMHDGAGHGQSHDHVHEPADGTAGYRPHESPWSMLVPLSLLALGAVCAGFVFTGFFLDPEQGARYWNSSLAFDAHLMHAMHEIPLWARLSTTVVMAAGFLIAFWAYIVDTGLPARVVAHIGPLHTFLVHKWYFDELYDLLFVRGGFAVGRFFWQRGDRQTIDRFGPDGAWRLVAGGGVLTRKLQSGYLYSYALVMLLGLAAATTWAVTR